MSTATIAFDPYAYEFHEDPYPVYERLREEAPLFRDDDLGIWVLSRHEDVLAGLRDSDRLSSAYGVSLDPSVVGPSSHKTASFLAMDPPRHGRMRGLVSRGFTPRRVLDLEPRIRELTRRHLAEALELGSFDFIADFAGKLPMDVVSEMLGVPTADRAELRINADLVMHREDGVYDIPPEGLDAVFKLIEYYIALVAERKAHPGEDLVSALLEAEIDGDRLTDDEIVGFLFLMVIAGNETTTKLLGNAWYWGARFPDERAKPFADRERVPDWVEETLRYDTSSQLLARTARVDFELYGETIRERDRVVLLIGSANRDPRVFPHADVYDLDRDHPLPQLASFGFGRHFCLGASLARLEARVALEELVDAVATYDVDETGIARVHSVNVRGFAALPTTVTPR